MKVSNLVLGIFLLFSISILVFSLIGCGGGAAGVTTTTGGGGGGTTTTSTSGGGGNYTTLPLPTTTTLLPTSFSWSQATSSAAFPARQGLGCVSYNNKLWVMGGLQGSTYYNDVWSSSDGVTWTQATAEAAFSKRYAVACVVHNDGVSNKMWLIGGYDRASLDYLNDVWSSADGVTWTLVTGEAGFSKRQSHAAVDFGGKLWVIGGLDPNPKNDVWSSTDGITWTRATASAGFSGRYNHASVVFGGKLWVMGGFNGGYTLGDIWSSSDGVAWTEVNYFAVPLREGFCAVDYNSQLWVIGGQNGATHYNDAWYSTDGGAWTATTSPAIFSARYGHAGAVLNNKIWVIGGYENSEKNDVWSGQ